MKILLTCIIKGDSEYTTFKRMLESFMPYCDGLAVVINGISDKTNKSIALITQYNGKYIRTTPTTHHDLYTKKGKGFFFSNFAEARSLSFRLADTMEGYDWYTWADVDDLLLNGQELRKIADQSLKLGADVVFMTYWYAIRVRKDGTFNEQCVEIEHLRERLLRPKMFEWKSRLHEVALPKDGNYQPKIAQYEYDSSKNQMLAWAHVTTSTRVDAALTRNIQILEIQIKEEQYKDPRTVYYLAKTYFDSKKDDDRTLELLQMYIDGPNPSGWAEERAHAYQYICNVHARNGRHTEAIEALFKGIKEYPDSHMHYLLLAKEYSELEQFAQSDFWLDMALKMEKMSTSTTIGNPLEIKYMAASLQLNRAWRAKKLDEAVYWAEIREKLSQDSDGFLEVVKEAKQMNDAAKNVLAYAKWLKDTGHSDKIQHLLESLPADLGREPFAHHIANEFKAPKIWDNKSIVYYANFGGEFFEKFSGKSVMQGVGGSETAVYELSKRWAKMGYHVTVYADPREDAGVIEGVDWRPWYEMNWKDQFNILILWRSPHLLDRDIKAKQLIMDLHDVASQLEWTEERMKKIDKVMFKSQFHRKYVPKLPDEKIEIISNGIQI